jgi:translation initiation factor 2 beta subunit (eIF-2beta)/eIF-5
MGILQKTLEGALQDLPKKFVVASVEKKLAAQGIKLSSRERELLASLLKTDGSGTFTFRCGRFWDRKQIIIGFSDKEVDELVERVKAFISCEVPRLFESTAEEIYKETFAALSRRWPAESRRARREKEGFRNRLQKRWKVPLERLKMLLTIAQEFGDVINDELRKSSDPSRKFLVDVLTRSHATACHVAGEIVCLLEGGFADGAMARWRTLHEIAVVANFIADHGEDLAERYVLHQNIESKKAAVEYERWQERLQLDPLDPKEVKRLEGEFTILTARFGPAFKESHGWAAHHLKKPNPTFADIERAVRSDHLRPYYRLASHNVHANPKGVFFKLGMMGETDILLAGPSNAGLADPGQGAAISLARACSNLTVLLCDLDTLVALKMIAHLMDEVREAFGVAHADLQRDAKGAV